MASQRRSFPATPNVSKVGSKADKGLSKQVAAEVAQVRSKNRQKAYTTPDMTGSQGFDEFGGGPSAKGWSKRRGNVG